MRVGALSGRGTETALPEHAVADLASRLRGELIRPGDAGYQRGAVTASPATPSATAGS